MTGFIPCPYCGYEATDIGEKQYIAAHLNSCPLSYNNTGEYLQPVAVPVLDLKEVVSHVP